MARVTKYTQWTEPDGQEQIRAWVKAGKSDREIAELMHVTPQTLSAWRRRHPEIKSALVRLRTIDGKRIDSHDLPHGGPERKLSNVQVLQDKVRAWEEACKADNTPLTKTGLAIALGVSKCTINRYINDITEQPTTWERCENTGELHPVTIRSVIKRAVEAIENDLEIRMITGRGNVAGIIFDLKNNHGYADKSEVTTAKIPARQSNEDIDKRIKELLDKSGADVIPFKTGTK